MAKKKVLSPEQIAKMQAAKAKNRRSNPMKLSAAKTISKYCREQCCCGDRPSHVECSIPKCFLYPYRFGKMPTDMDAKEHAEAISLLETTQDCED